MNGPGSLAVARGRGAKTRRRDELVPWEWGSGMDRQQKKKSPVKDPKEKNKKWGPAQNRLAKGKGWGGKTQEKKKRCGRRNKNKKVKGAGQREILTKKRSG